MTWQHDSFIIPYGPDMFSTFFDNSCKKSKGFPLYDAYNDENGYVIEIALAGWSKKDVSIEFKKNNLSIHGKKDKSENRDINYFIKSLSYKNWDLEFTFPNADADGDKIIAKFENGLLIIKIPFKEDSKPTTIDIQ